MSDILEILISSHARSASAFRQVVERARIDPTVDVFAEDTAAEAEEAALLALLSYPPRTIKEARRRADYLMETRFPTWLDDEAFAFLASCTNESRWKVFSNLACCEKLSA